MLGTTFYHSTIRKYTSAMGALFNNISIVRTDDQNVVQKTIKVPLAFGPKHKWIQRAQQRSSLNTTGVKTQMTLPRMAFEFVGYQYDQSRKTNTLNKCQVKDPNGETTMVQLAPIPYDFTYQLHIMTKNMDDGLQIIEQIIPYFSPDFTITVKEIPELGIVRDIPIISNGISATDTYEGDFTAFRILTWTLEFTMKGNVYPPITDSKLIKLINTNIYLDPDIQEVFETISTVPDPIDQIPSDDATIATTITVNPVFDENDELLFFLLPNGEKYYPNAP